MSRAIEHMSKVPEVFFWAVASHLSPHICVNGPRRSLLTLVFFAPDLPPSFQATVYVVQLHDKDGTRKAADRSARLHMLKQFWYVLEYGDLTELELADVVQKR